MAQVVWPFCLFFLHLAVVLFDCFVGVLDGICACMLVCMFVCLHGWLLAYMFLFRSTSNQQVLAQETINLCVSLRLIV